MSTGLDRGGGVRGEKKFFLSTHRCPEVDLLPHHKSGTKTPPPCSLVPAEKSSEFTYTDQSEANYLDIPSTCRSEEEEEEEDRSISDWSEEDLSLHFSPSVILPSGDEESDPESGFECIDITVETLVKGQEGEGLKMVPKRQIQLKKKAVSRVINQEQTEKLQVILKDGPAEGGVSNSEVSANELLCSTIHHRPDLLLRQHSMPASLHTSATTSSDVNSYRAYRGPVAGANQGFHVGTNSRQRLQKSFSLDETKTKMASSIIKSVLSKKMQVEQNNSKTSYHQKPAVLSSFPQPAHQQMVREGGGGKTGGGVCKVPVHAVRDMRSLVKNTYSLSFFTAPMTTPENKKPRGMKMIGQEGSSPPTYQQAVGVKGHNKTKKSCQASVYSSSSGGHISKIAACLSQSQDRKLSNTFTCPITQERRGSEPIINRIEVDDVTWPVMLDLPNNSPVSSDLPELSQPERAAGMSHPDGSYLMPSMFIQPSPSTSKHPEGTQSPLSAKEQSSVLDLSSQLAPTSSQPIRHSSFYTPTTQPTLPPSLHRNVLNINYMHRPLSYIQTQMQPQPPAPTLYLLRRSEENQSAPTGNTSNQLDSFSRTCPPHQTRTLGDQESNGNPITPAIYGQHEQQKLQQQFQQQQFLYSVHGFLPAQLSSDFLIDVKGSAGAPGALLSGALPCHVTLNPKTGQCVFVNMPPQPQRKMLLDPETGQYVQVFIPANSSTPCTSVFPVHYANHASFMANHNPSMINTTPSLLSVMQFQPMVPVSCPYAHPRLLSNSAHTIN